MKTTATNSSTADLGIRRISQFQPDTIEEYPNLRYLLALHLANEAEDQPPQHDDPWIQDTAELLYVNLHKTPDFAGTLRQRYILDALLLPQKGALVIKLLECFLASDVSHEQIIRKCNIDPPTLEAYAAIFCDFSDHHKLQAWGRLQLNPVNFTRGPAGAIATIMQNNCFWDAAEGVENTVEVLCRMEGPTLADGLSPRTDPGFLHEFGIRGGFAQTLLSRNKKNIELMHRFDEANRGSAAGAPMSEEAIELGLQILRRTKIPQELQTEIMQLREFYRPASNAEMEVPQ